VIVTEDGPAAVANGSNIAPSGIDAPRSQPAAVTPRSGDRHRAAPRGEAIGRGARHDAGRQRGEAAGLSEIGLILSIDGWTSVACVAASSPTPRARSLAAIAFKTW
jgi:hypothetical protein